MLCEKCQQREATVHRQVIINGVAHSEHLCAECAAREGGMDPFAAFLQNDSFGASLARMMASFLQDSETREPETAQDGLGPCPACGMSWEDFERNGFLGCDTCYSHFKDALPPLLQRLHSAGAENTAAESSAPQPRTMNAKEHLKLELEQAIKDERFEDAAHLRDAIQALERVEHRGASENES